MPIDQAESLNNAVKINSRCVEATLPVRILQLASVCCSSRPPIPERGMYSAQ